MATSRKQPTDELLYQSPTSTRWHPSTRNRTVSTPVVSHHPRQTSRQPTTLPNPPPLADDRTPSERFLSDLDTMERRLRSRNLLPPELQREKPTHNTSRPATRRSISPSLYRGTPPPKHHHHSVSIQNPYSPSIPSKSHHSISSLAAKNHRSTSTPTQNYPSTPNPVHLMPSHQVKRVPIYTGCEGSTIEIEDWVRDTRYLIETTAIPTEMQFSTIVRYLGGAARKLVLNLPPDQQTINFAFAELKAQFGDSLMSGDPLAEFYERVRLQKESPGIYAVELEATLRTVEERMNKTQPWPNRNKMLTQQFMRGVRNEKITNRLAPMKPREMSFRELQIELRQIERENRMGSTMTTDTTKALSQPQYARPTYQSAPPKQTKAPATQEAQRTPLNSSNDEVLQNLILTVQKLTQKVDQMSTMPIQYQHRRQEYQASNRQITCHKCGQDGHIARGCRNMPSNYQGPRPKGKPSEAQKYLAQ